MIFNKIKNYIWNNSLKKIQRIILKTILVIIEKIDNLSIKIILSLILFFILILFLGVVSRLVRYGLPLESIKFSTLPIFIEKDIFFNYITFIFLFIIFYVIVLIIHRIDRNLNLKIPIFQIITFNKTILFSIAIFLIYFGQLEILSFYICSIIFYDILINFKERIIIFKVFLLTNIFILVLTIFIESVNYLRLSIHKKEPKFITNFIDQIVYNYILEYRIPFIAKVNIDNNVDEVILILGINNDYIFYLSHSTIVEILNTKIKNKTKENICREKSVDSLEQIVYPSRLIDFLETTALVSIKFERKRKERINIITEYESFKENFCEKETVDE